MTDKFKNKYRIPSARSEKWDYGWNGLYFVTICTQNRDCYLGNILDGKMQLSEIGEMANKYWQEIPQHYPYAKLDVFVVMPNHMHGIIIIDKPDDGRDGRNRRDAINRVSTTQTPTPTQTQMGMQQSISSPTTLMNAITKQPGGITGIKNPMLHENLSKIIRWYKGRVTFESRKIHADFAWQSRFHDHIIRNDKSYQIISEYIISNPLKFKDDKFNPDKKEDN